MSSLLIQLGKALEKNQDSLIKIPDLAIGLTKKEEKAIKNLGGVPREDLEIIQKKLQERVTGLESRLHKTAGLNIEKIEALRAKFEQLSEGKIQKTSLNIKDEPTTVFPETGIVEPEADKPAGKEKSKFDSLIEQIWKLSQSESQSVVLKKELKELEANFWAFVDSASEEDTKLISRAVYEIFRGHTTNSQKRHFVGAIKTLRAGYEDKEIEQEVKSLVKADKRNCKELNKVFKNHSEKINGIITRINAEVKKKKAVRFKVQGQNTPAINTLRVNKREINSFIKKRRDEFFKSIVAAEASVDKEQELAKVLEQANLIHDEFAEKYKSEGLEGQEKYLYDSAIWFTYVLADTFFVGDAENNMLRIYDMRNWLEKADYNNWKTNMGINLAEKKSSKRNTIAEKANIDKELLYDFERNYKAAQEYLANPVEVAEQRRTALEKEVAPTKKDIVHKEPVSRTEKKALIKLIKGRKLKKAIEQAKALYVKYSEISKTRELQLEENTALDVAKNFIFILAYPEIEKEGARKNTYPKNWLVDYDTANISTLLRHHIKKKNINIEDINDFEANLKKANKNIEKIKKYLEEVDSGLIQKKRAPSSTDRQGAKKTITKEKELEIIRKSLEVSTVGKAQEAGTKNVTELKDAVLSNVQNYNIRGLLENLKEISDKYYKDGQEKAGLEPSQIKLLKLAKFIAFVLANPEIPIYTKDQWKRKNTFNIIFRKPKIVNWGENIKNFMSQVKKVKVGRGGSIKEVKPPLFKDLDGNIASATKKHQKSAYAKYIQALQDNNYEKQVKPDLEYKNLDINKVVGKSSYLKKAFAYFDTTIPLSIKTSDSSIKAVMDQNIGYALAFMNNLGDSKLRSRLNGEKGFKVQGEKSKKLNAVEAFRSVAKNWNLYIEAVDQFNKRESIKKVDKKLRGLLQNPDFANQQRAFAIAFIRKFKSPTTIKLKNELTVAKKEVEIFKKDKAQRNPHRH